MRLPTTAEATRRNRGRVNHRPFDKHARRTTPNIPNTPRPSSSVRIVRHECHALYDEYTHVFVAHKSLALIFVCITTCTH